MKESAAPEENEIPKLDSEYNFCSILLAVLRETIHSRNKISTATSDKWASPIYRVSG
jgi:hypothetical protein